MVYQLFITTVLPSDEDIKDVKENFEENVNAMERDPLTNFRNIEKKHTAGISYFNRPLKISDFQKVDASKACEFFTNSFKDPSDFVVVIVGDIDPATAKPLILKYLGGIPVHSQSLLKYHRDELTDLPFTLPTYIVREVVCSRMVDEKCIVSLCFRVEFNNENLLENMLFVLFFKMLFDSKINDVLRFEHGKIYSCDVCQHLNEVLSKAGTTLGKITLEFSCDPDSYEEPIDLTLKEMLRLQKEGPSVQDISAQCAKDKRNCEDILQDNEGWICRILDSYRSANYSGNIDFSFELQNEIHLKFWKQLTPETAKIALRTILPFPCTELYTAVILKPEQRV